MCAPQRESLQPTLSSAQTEAREHFRCGFLSAQATYNYLTFPHLKFLQGIISRNYIMHYPTIFVHFHKI